MLVGNARRTLALSSAGAWSYNVTRLVASQLGAVAPVLASRWRLGKVYISSEASPNTISIIRKVPYGVTLQDVGKAASKARGPSIIEAAKLKDAKSWKYLDFESNLEDPRTVGHQLALSKTVEGSLDVWEALFEFRSRVYGIDGAKLIWKWFQKTGTRNASQLYLTPNLWNGLVQLALQDQAILWELYEYVEAAYQQKGTKPDDLYFAVISSLLRRDLSLTREWHGRLRAFEPTKDQVRKLAKQFAHDAAASSTFRSFCSDFSNLGGFYEQVVPALYANKLFEEALEWHIFLVLHGELPPDPLTPLPLFSHLARTGRESTANQLRTQLTKSKLHKGKEHEYPKKAVIDATPEPVILTTLTAKLNNTPNKTLSDAFTARLFATRVFSVVSVVKGLSLIATEKIGPLTIRAMALRAVRDNACQPLEVIEMLKNLKEANISIGTSRFSRLVEHLASQGEAELLHDVVTSDMHPDVFEDLGTQIALLGSYFKAGDRRQVTRTLAILLLDVKPDNKLAYMQNYLLGSSLSSGSTEATQQMLQSMFDHDTPIFADTQQRMLSRYTRDISKESLSNTELQELLYMITIWQQFMRSGTIIQPTNWQVVLMTLASPYHILEYERLALWLGRWYKSELFRTLQVSQTRGKRYSDSVPGVVKANTKDSGKDFPEIDDIFGPKVINRLVRLGYDRHVMELSGWADKNLSKKRTAVVDAREDMSLWGLRLLKQLQDMGVAIDSSEVRKACTKLLSVVRSAKKKGKMGTTQLKSLPKEDSEKYRKAMQEIWGPELSPNHGMVQAPEDLWKIEAGSTETNPNT